MNMIIAKHRLFTATQKLFFATFFSAAMTSANAEVLYSDSFETGSYGCGEFQSCANGSPAWQGSGSVYVVKKGAKTGAYSLGFKYPVGEPMAEQRFQLGTPRKEVWLSYWLRVPDNYSHGTGGNYAKNNKFFSIFMDGYEGSGDGSTFWLSMEPAGGGNTDLAFTYSRGSHTGSLGYDQYKPFIDANSDRGKWMHMVIHLKAQSAVGANNGIIQTWRRWESESSYTKLHEKLDAPLKVPASGPQGFNVGYLMGWANGTYAVETEWFVDDFVLSTTSLLGGAVATTTPEPAPEPTSKPLAPQLVTH